MEDVQALLRKGAEGDHKAMAEAENLIHGILAQQPNNWAAIFFLANIYLHYGKDGIAIVLFERAAQLEPNCPETWNNLGTAYRKENHNTDAERCLKKALEIKPDDPDVYNNLATLHINEGSPDKALEYLNKGLALSGAHNQLHWNRGLALLELEQWDEGFPEYAWGVASNDRLTKNYGDALWWDGDAHPNDKIVVYGEQGIGDEIMFASMLPDLQNAFQGKVIFDAHPRLVSLFEGAFPEVHVYDTRKILDRPVSWLPSEMPIQWKVPIGNLGKWFRRKEEDFPKVPYIYPDREKVEEYKEWIRLTGPGPYLAVGWVGGHKKTRKDIRSIKLADLTPIIQRAGTVFSVQYTSHGEEDTEAYFKETATRIWHFPEVVCCQKAEKYILMKDGTPIAESKNKEELKPLRVHYGGEIEHVHDTPAYDYGETAAFVAALTELGGRVVTVNSSLVHLMGAMGLPCYTLTPAKPAWRYGLKRKDMVWYPNVRQFRQTPIGGWTEAIKTLEQVIGAEFDPYENVVAPKPRRNSILRDNK